MDVRDTHGEADDAIKQSRELVRRDKPEEALEELRRAWNGLRILLSSYDPDEDADEDVDSILGLLDLIADEAATVWDRYKDQIDADWAEDVLKPGPRTTDQSPTIKQVHCQR
jgi:hypothetical protein